MVFIKKKKIIYLHFDTFIISEKYRKRNFANILINFTNSIITFNKLMSILYCEKKIVNFYKKYYWKVASYHDFKLSIKKNSKKCVMTYNC